MDLNLHERTLLEDVIADKIGRLARPIAQSAGLIVGDHLDLSSPLHPDHSKHLEYPNIAFVNALVENGVTKANIIEVILAEKMGYLIGRLGWENNALA